MPTRILFLVVAVLISQLGTALPTARGAILGTFNSTRAGGFNLLTSIAAMEIRDSLATNFPDMTLTGTDKLTPAYLSGIDAILLHPIANFGTNITPLSAAEQSALFDFVKQGGAALMIADSYGSSAAQNLVDAFGLKVAGLTPGPDPGTISAPPFNPIVNGPFGTVSSFLTDEGYWFTDLGPYAKSIATYTGNGLPSIVVIERGAIAPTSGPVVIFGDVNAFGDAAFGYQFQFNETLMLNALAYAVPEPSTLISGLLGVGLVAGASLRRRR
jgi:hypothetical protein